MSNKKIGLGILAVALVFAMTVVGCDNGSTSGNGGGNGGGHGNTLNLSGQVYTMLNWFLGTYTEYEGENRTVYLFNDRATAALTTGTIIDGQLALVYGSPPNSELTSMWWTYLSREEITATPAETQMFFVDELGVDSVTSSNRLTKEHRTRAADDRSGTDEEVFFIYVNRNVTVSSDGNERSWPNSRRVVESFTINLRRGWNAIHQNAEWEQEITGTPPTPFYTTTITFSTGSLANTRWILQERD